MVSDEPTRNCPSRLFWWAAAGILVSTVVLLALAYFGRDGVRVGGVCQMGLLAIAAIVAAWYADETQQMKKAMLRPHVSFGSEPSGKQAKKNHDFFAENHGPGEAVYVEFAYPGDGAPEFSPLACSLCPREQSDRIAVPDCHRTVLIRYRSTTGERFIREARVSNMGKWRAAPHARGE